MNELIDILYAVDIAGWSLWEIAMLMCGLLCIVGALLIILIAKQREEPPQ